MKLTCLRLWLISKVGTGLKTSMLISKKTFAQALTAAVCELKFCIVLFLSFPSSIHLVSRIQNINNFLSHLLHHLLNLQLKIL
jgi:hypothetical protein